MRELTEEEKEKISEDILAGETEGSIACDDDSLIMWELNLEVVK